MIDFLAHHGRVVEMTFGMEILALRLKVQKG
jgi:hypothetical protein